MQNNEITHLTADTKERLDAFLSSRLTLSRKEAKTVIESGFCSISGKTVTKSSISLKIGDIVEIKDFSLLFTKELAVNPLKPDILYEDESVIIVHKPSGLTVHEGSGVTESTLCDFLKNSGYGLANSTGEGREGIVHRLDKETSGLMVIAKTDEAALNLKKQFESKEAGRYYLAVIEPPLREDITVEASIARHLKNRIKMSVQPDGKTAKSAFKKIILSKNGKLELIAAKLFTGRTHQIRAHLAHIGRHIVGDDLYGFNHKNGNIGDRRVMLHAAVLYFYHPKSGKKVDFFVKPPEDFLELFNKYFDEERSFEIFDPEFIVSCFDSGL